MTRLALAFLLALTVPALAAAYDKTETTSAYTLRLRVPSEAMAIAPLKAEIFARFAHDSAEIKTDSVSDQKDMPEHFHAYALDTLWRVTFNSPDVLSLSGYSFIDQNGAHPNAGYDSIVWDKSAQRAVPISELFGKDQLDPAFKAIATYAKAELIKFVSEQEGAPADSSMADEGIAPDPKKLGHYALTYAKGQTHANGIVLLYGAGEVWAHVLGDVKLSVPVSVFSKYLTPRWKAEFN
jgi:hypothetical protein